MRIVASHVFHPIGPLFDPHALTQWPLRALRGGPDGIAVSFRANTRAVKTEILAAGECSKEDEEWAIATARGLAAVDDDPRAFYEMVKKHDVLAPLARKLDARLDRTRTVFEAFVRAVCGQLVTGFEAQKAVQRLVAIAGEPIPGTKLRAPPLPEAVRRVPMWRLREIGIGSRRAATVRAGAMRGPQLERLIDDSPEEAMRKLQSLQGVGPWTANAVARDAFAYADAVPIGDLHAKRIVTKALGEGEGTDDAMLEDLEPFRPHRARVVHLLEQQHASSGDHRLPRVDKHRRMPWRY